MTIQQYLDRVSQRFKSGISTEHTYRGDFQTLLENLTPGILVTNEPSRIECGAPDYILTRQGVPIGYIEAKDLGADLNSRLYKEQFTRYKQSLGNLIITNYLSFQLYRNGEFVSSVTIAEVISGRVVPKKENYKAFQQLIREFIEFTGLTITSASKLSIMMAAKARLLADIIELALKQTSSDTNAYDVENNSLQAQYESFKRILIHDINEKGFADIYAQTIAYGMFAARLQDPNAESFTRQMAAELIPKTNPFLRKLFQYIAGYDLDDRIKWIVDALADMFHASDLPAILQDFGRKTQQTDPMIHFYETFLSEYDPKLRKSRGVWYTPEPVVKFIVRAVDDILKQEFDLPLGLADTSKTRIKVDNQGKKAELDVHKVQILDPATGTGTFLAEVVRHIHHKFQGQQGIWSNYVEDHLIPRLNGFEILMASYAMAHLKLDLLLKETGYEPKNPRRFRVFLTNSLEEHHPDTGNLFANWLSAEASAANQVKRDTPVMVIIGNPPYSGESKNKGSWIMNLMEDYKKEPGGKIKLKERNPKWINDDYVKFIRYAQHFVEKNGTGVIGFINPHGYLDNTTFRGMRWNLLKTFDKIFTIDLHGNTKKKEISPDGTKDENVFDIQQGVSINFFIKSGKKSVKELAQVFNIDIYGRRESKYVFLNDKKLHDVDFSELKITKPNYFFKEINFKEHFNYYKGFSVNKLFIIGNSGVVTKRDKLNIHFSELGVKQMIRDVLELDESLCRIKYSIPKDVRDWNFSLARQDIKSVKLNYKFVKEINYRPFDKRYFYYTGKSKGVVGWPVPVVSDHLLHTNNFGLMTNKKIEVGEFQHIHIYKGIVESHAISMKEINYVFPLYLYQPLEDNQIVETSFRRTPNLDTEIVNRFVLNLNILFTPEKEEGYTKFGPIDILDYVYAILHSRTYRDKYKELLKIDFPRVPYPEDVKQFWNLVKLGGELRLIHLMESPILDKPITAFPVSGSNIVEKINFQTDSEKDIGRVWINADQYFDHVPCVAWEFYIGGYQPAQKWLKDRKNRELNYNDIIHYQKIILALSLTDKQMKRIDNTLGDSI